MDSMSLARLLGVVLIPFAGIGLLFVDQSDPVRSTQMIGLVGGTVGIITAVSYHNGRDDISRFVACLVFGVSLAFASIYLGSGEIETFLYFATFISAAFFTQIAHMCDQELRMYGWKFGVFVMEVVIRSASCALLYNFANIVF